MLTNAYTSLKRQLIGGTLLKEGVYEAGRSLPVHFHEQPNLCLVVTGNCAERLGGKTIDFKPLTLGYLAAGDEHSLHTGAAPVRCFGIEPAPAVIERIRDCSLKINNSVYANGGLPNDLVLKIYREFRFADKASELAIEALLLELLVEIARRQPLSGEKRPPRWLAAAEELLRAEFLQPPELAAIAAAAGVHPVHLAREFRRFFKCTMGEFVRRRQIDFACGKLARSRDSIITIALSAGFADQSHFTRECRRLTGFTPRQYRKLFEPR